MKVWRFCSSNREAWERLPTKGRDRCPVAKRPWLSYTMYVVVTLMKFSSLGNPQFRAAGGRFSVQAEEGWRFI